MKPKQPTEAEINLAIAKGQIRLDQYCKRRAAEGWKRKAVKGKVK